MIIFNLFSFSSLQQKYKIFYFIILKYFYLILKPKLKLIHQNFDYSDKLNVTKRPQITLS